jgi:enamine deaminase RidA (YjgF/YER057c/UK114 family)
METRVDVTFENPKAVAPPLGAYSHLAIVPADSELLVIAGQVGNDIDGHVPEDPVDQYRQALRNLLAVVRSKGGEARDIFKLNTYLVERLPLDRVRAARQEVLGDAAPAATLIYVAGLASEGLLVEVEGWAVRSLR